MAASRVPDVTWRTRMTTTRFRRSSAAVAAVVAVTTVLAGCAATRPERPASEHDAPRALVDDFVTAFNDGDSAALSDLFAEHAEFVNIYGMRMSGRSGIAKGHAQAFASRLSRAELEVTSFHQRELDDDVVVAQAEWSLRQPEDADRSKVVPDSSGVLSFTVERTADDWEFASGANVVRSTPPS
jgi:uncharacterized protein (TIGR02246 family)